MGNLKSDNLYDPETWNKLTENQKEALLEKALDIRKFEISLYWTRAGYFWTFIAITFSAYGFSYMKYLDSPGSEALKEILVLLSTIGIIVSLAWVLVNKGSKHWQQNWENHLDFLEDAVYGPLYKTVILDNAKPGEYGILSSSPYSVSKINLIISYIVLLLWFFLIIAPFKMPFCELPHGLRVFGMVVGCFAACYCLIKWGKTGAGVKTVRVMRRRTVMEAKE